MREKQGKIRRFALRSVAALTCALERTEVTQQLLCTPSAHIGGLQGGTGPQSSSWREAGEMDPSGSLQFSFPIGQVSSMGGVISRSFWFFVCLFLIPKCVYWNGFPLILIQGAFMLLPSAGASSASLASPPVGGQSTVEQPAHKTPIGARLRTR